MKKILLEGSARHVHISVEDGKILFGEDYSLHNKRELSQPGQYLCEEKVKLVGPRGAIDRVSVLGPERKATQVEISLTDARALGITPPVRESGDLSGSASLTLVGPAGSVELSEGVIVPRRHVHLTPETASGLGLKDKDVISVKTSGERAVVFGEVVARVSPSFGDAMHLDFDEMNAAGLSGEAYGDIIIG